MRKPVTSKADKPKGALSVDTLGRARLAGLLLETMASDHAMTAAARKKIAKAGQLLAEACQLIGTPAAREVMRVVKTKKRTPAKGRK